MCKLPFAYGGPSCKINDGLPSEWDAKNIYQKVLDKNEGNPSFILHDGPPYANGNLHSHTVVHHVK
jgi:isoleucyl-tRNA synthetase